MTEYSFLQFPPEAVQIDPKIIENLPGSARRVLEAVSEKGPLTHNELGLATGLPPRTIRYAVRRLKDHGVLDSLSSLRDCRTCYFFVSRRYIDPVALEQARVRAGEAVKNGHLVERVREAPNRPVRPAALQGRYVGGLGATEPSHAVHAGDHPAAAPTA